MAESKKPKGPRTPWWLWLAVAAIVVFCLFPFYWMVNISLKTGSDLSSAALLPPNPTLKNYTSIFQNSDFTNGLKNSAIVSLTTTVLALIFLFGAAGRLIALVLLVLQLAASGGSYPVELSPSFFGAIHNFVPVTQSVNAFRHALSGAFQGSYVTFMLVLLGIAALSVGAGLLGRRRWELVADHDFKPLITSPLVSEEVHHEAEGVARG